MIVFFIILAVLVLIIAAILSVSATLTVTYDSNWKTTVKILWIEREIELTKLLSFVLFPEKKAEEDKANRKKKSDAKKAESVKTDETDKASAEEITEKQQSANADAQNKKAEKENHLKKLWKEEGIVGIMGFATNLFQTASDAALTLFKGFHIYSLYVKILIGGGDAADIAQAYGRVCKYYYPLKGFILNGMKVDNYDDWIAPDFIAPRNEYGFQLIGSLSIATALKVLFAAGKTYLINIIKNK